MKANELRIGNLLEFRVTCKVCEIQENCFYVNDELGTEYKNTICDIKPIPLTEEWLLKFGFENDTITATKKGFDFSIGFYASGFYLCKSLDEMFGVEIKHVHQLQNLYFALTGEELILKS